MSEAIARARRAGTHVALIFADLDGFKRINDTQGHDAGDDVLRAVSGVLTGVLRESDTLARVGGDEFVLLLPDLPQADAALVVAERILRELHAAVTAEVGWVRSRAVWGWPSSPGTQMKRMNYSGTQTVRCTRPRGAAVISFACGNRICAR